MLKQQERDIWCHKSHQDKHLLSLGNIWTTAFVVHWKISADECKLKGRVTNKICPDNDNRVNGNPSDQWETDNKLGTSLFWKQDSCDLS